MNQIMQFHASRGEGLKKRSQFKETIHQPVFVLEAQNTEFLEVEGQIGKQGCEQGSLRGSL
jgi:hypothetical protein